MEKNNNNLVNEIMENLFHTKFYIRKSMDYQKLLPLFKDAGLEVELDDPNPRGLLTCFEVVDKKTDEIIGASSIINNNGIYQVKTLAITKEYQGGEIGRYLMDKMVDELREWGANKVILNAKEPGFYEKVGFIESPMDTKDIEYDCCDCEHFNRDCFPKIMARKI